MGELSPLVLAESEAGHVAGALAVLGSGPVVVLERSGERLLTAG